MWRPDRSVRGPDRPTNRDIDPLNRVFAEAFTDRYSRDGLVGVRVPQLNPLVWRYAIEDAGDGTFIAHVKSSPVDGRANDELIELVARQFGCSKAAVSIKSGASARTKLLRIESDRGQ